MKREQFIESKQLKLTLVSVEKKLMQLRHRYIIEIITDRKVEQIKKTYRDFEYFNKILHKKLGLKDKQLKLKKHFRTNDNYADLEFYIKRLNSGYLIYKTQNEALTHRNADLSVKKQVGEILQLEPVKTKQLRNYLYDLLYREDELFIDGVDSDSDSEDFPEQIPSELKAQFKKQSNSEHVLDALQSKYKKENSPSKNPFKRFINSNRLLGNGTAERAIQKIERVGIHTNDIKNSVFVDTSRPRQKSNQSGTLARALKNLAFKARNAGHKAAHFYQNFPETKNLRNVLKNITKCWIKFPNNYKLRDRSKIYKPFIWQQYSIAFTQNTIELINLTTLHKHRKMFVIFQCDVEINFQEYTKLIVKNKIDNNPLEIRLSLDSESQEISEEYLALYTFVKETVKEQQQKLQIFGTSDKHSRVCNKVRIRISLKQKFHKPNSVEQFRNSDPLTPTQGYKASVHVNLPHGRQQKQHFQFKQIREASSNVKSVIIKIIHSSIEIFANVHIDTYIDIDFPILDNFGALDITVNQNIKQTSFLPNFTQKDALCTLHLPVQTIYDYMYNQDMPNRRKTEIKAKMIEVKHTKLNLTFDYKCIGNYQSYCSYNSNDLFEDDEPPKQFNRDEFRMNNNRLKRIIWSIQMYTGKIKDLKNFTYPNLSYLFYCFLALSCIFYDNNGAFFWAMVLLLFALFYNSPVYDVYVRDTMEILKLHAKKNNFDKFLFKRNPLIEEEFVVPLKKKKKLQFLQDFKLTYKNKRGIYKKYKRLVELLLQAQIILTKFVSFIEKLKNLFIWYHFKKTQTLFFIILSFVIILLVFPVRIILCAVIIKQMLKGVKYHSNIQDINRVVIIELIRIIIRENNLHAMGLYFKEHNKKFEIKTGQIEVFYKTCHDLIGEWLEIDIEMGEIKKRTTNMAQFVTNLSKSKSKYQIKKEVCQKFGFSLQWSKTQNSLKKFIELVYGFIVTIPSDKYIMGVRKASGEQESQGDEVENIIDRQLLNF